MSSTSSIFLTDMHAVGMMAPFELAAELERVLGNLKNVRTEPPSPMPRYAIQGVPQVR